MSFPEVKSPQIMSEQIPLDIAPVAGWKDLPIVENGEPLVPLGPFSERFGVFTSSVYAAEHSNSPYWGDDRTLEGSIITQFVRQDVADSIELAQGLLPFAHYLVVFDSYRGLEVQGALYDHYYKNLAQQHTNWSAEQLSVYTQRYVSLPSTESSRPSPHNTGGSVDLAVFSLPDTQAHELARIDVRLQELFTMLPLYPTADQEARDPLCRERYQLEMQRIGLMRHFGSMLDFGTPFDHGGPEASLDYYERLEGELSLGEIVARDNRRLLYAVMKTAGLQPYPDEWWHFNAAKSQMGAKVTGLVFAEYGAASMSEENLLHETMRKQHFAGLARIQEGLMQSVHYSGKTALSAELIRLNEEVLTAIGDPRISYMARAAIMEP